MKKFETGNKFLRKQFDNIAWIEESGVGEIELYNQKAVEVLSFIATWGAIQ